MNVVVTGSYIVFLLLLSVFTYFFIDPNLFYLNKIYTGIHLTQRVATTVALTCFVLIFFLFYFLFLRLTFNNKIDKNDMIRTIKITFVLLVLSFPAMLSTDIYNYIAFAKVAFFYQENPFIIMPIEFTSEPLLAFMHFANIVSVYGPFWILLSGIPLFVGMNQFMLTLFGFKLFVGIFYLATVFLLFKMSTSWKYVVIFSLNPLVLIETFISGHNDIVMMFFALLALYMLNKKRIFLAIIFLILSISIKYATIALLPVFLFIFWKMYTNQQIDWQKMYFYSALSMMFVFFLSPLRVEIYPWYAIWFLVFIPLIPEKKLLIYFSVSLSFGLLLRYIPYMLTGNHFGITPFIKTFLTFLPAVLTIMYLLLWPKFLSKRFLQR